jgi:hypothetical protein
MEKHRFLRRAAVFVTAVFLFSLLIGPALAIDAPKITVAPAWRPGTTLDSIDIGAANIFDAGTDDFRYVDVEVYVTTSVPFWAVQMTCTVSPTALTSYDDASNNGVLPGDGDPNNNVPAVTWGPQWGTFGTDFTGVVDPYIPATGTRTFTASRLGTVSPMGSNGVTTTILLATLRYRVKDLAAAATATFGCASSSIAFLNKNGNSVLAPTFTAPPNLNIITGYTITGSIAYQGRTSKANISMKCDGPDLNPDQEITIPVSSTDGKFTYNSRTQGTFVCDYYGHTLPSSIAAFPNRAPDIYLTGETVFSLTGQSINLLPVTLFGGNLNLGDTVNNNGTDQIINGNDLSLITAPGNWNKTTTAGDVNGDGKTDKVDLAILASNYGGYELVDNRHILYSLPRDFDATQNSRIWNGQVWGGSVTQFVPSPATKGRDLWPMLSPDGKTLAFIRDLGTNNVGLYTAPVTNGVVGAAVRVTPANATYSAFAPSWSPDGTRLAFVCSWFDDGTPGTLGNDARATGYLADQGNLCLIDANGRNFQNFTSKPGDAKARIYPPAWLSGHEVVYGGASDAQALSNPVCSNTLCYLNLQTGDSRKFDNVGADDFLLGGTLGQQVADMPVIRNGVLFYRFSDGTAFDNPTTRVVRWVDISTQNNIDNIPAYTTWANATTPPFHTDVVDDAGNLISDDVDYFNVAQGAWDIIFNETGGNRWGIAWWHQGALAGPTGLQWYTAFFDTVDDMVGNPQSPRTFFSPDDDSDPSYLFAWRNTANWVP